MTFTVTLTELLLAFLIIVAIVAVIALAMVLWNLIPAIRSLQRILSDCEEITAQSKESVIKTANLVGDASETAADAVHAVRDGLVSGLGAVGQLLCALPSLAKLLRKKR